MTRQLSHHALGTASAFGIPGIDGTDVSILSFNAFTADQSVALRPAGTGPITEWLLAMDVYIPSHAGEYTALMQTGGGDADLFLRGSGIGTMGVYQGDFPYDSWVRLAVSVTEENGEAVRRTYIDGALAGTQALGATDRWAIDPASGLRLFTDDDGETAPGYVSGLFFTADPPSSAEVAAILATAPRAAAGGFFPVAPTGTAIEVDFAGQTVTTRYGQADVLLEGSDYRTPIQIGDSRIGHAAQFGIDAPGADIPVLNYSAFTAEEGIRVTLPEGSADLTSYTMVWDLHTTDTGSWQGLLVLNTANTDDGEFFIHGNRGLGINGQYPGEVPADQWTRIALTVEDLGDGTSRLSKYIDGALVGTQTMPTARYTVDAETGFILMGDESGETASGYLAHFGIENRVLSADEIAALGTVDAAGPFPGGQQLGFDGYAPSGDLAAEVIDTLPLPPLPEVVGIQDRLVTVGSDPASYDLAEIFGADARDFTVTTTNGDAVAATIADGVLTLEFGALGLADLVVTATNGFGQELTDNIRIRVAGEGAYTIAIMPDTQDYTSNPAIAHNFTDMTQWIADNAANKGIGFVTHTGDITQWASTSQFDFAKEAMNILREAGIPFSVLPGNHDIGNGGSADVRETGPYNGAFSTEYMSQDATYAGAYDQEPDRYDNNYHLWTAADGTEWVFLNLEFGPRDDVLRWADDVLTQHADRKAMVMTHSYNNWNGRHDPLGGPLEGEGAGYNYGVGNDPEGSWDGEEIWREVISSHANVVFTAGGHIFGDGAQTVVSYNDYGNPVFQFLVNYQNGVANEANQGGNGGNGAIRLVTVDPANDAFYTETYFTEFDEYYEGYRGSVEESRDGLTGDYKGHQEEYTGVDLGDRDAQAHAEAGEDQVVTGPVSVSGAKSLNPSDDISSWTWSKDGRTVATGAEATLDLGAGVHDLTLTVETANGVKSDDTVRVIVRDGTVHLVETFNDGNADGWMKAADAASPYAFGTDADFGLPALGDGPTRVMKVDALAPDQGILVKPGIAGAIDTYTLVYDILIPEGADWNSLLQTSPTNANDGEVYIRNNGGTGGLGISSTYQGDIAYDQWNRVAVTFSVEGGQHVMRKYLNGDLIGTQTVDTNVADGSRWTLDGANGFLLFADENNETSDLFVSSVGFTPVALSGDALKALGGASATPPLASDQPDGAFQLNFEGALDQLDFGNADVTEFTKGQTNPTGPLFVKGSAAAGAPNPQGALFDQSDAADNLVVWKTGNWSDIIMEATIRSMDDDTIGVAFNHSDDGHYLLTLDNQTNTRQLVRVTGDQRTVLASENGGYIFNTAQDLFVSSVQGRITVTLDGIALFGGAVVDAEPLGAGTVGLYSSGQKSSIFDDVVVRDAVPTAHAGNDAMIIDWDGDGRETAALNAGASVGQGAWDTADRTLTSGRNEFTYTVDGDSDTVRYDLATGDRLIAADRFEDGDAEGWTIIDTTELGGPANWQVQDGALVETSGAYSRELTWSGANASDVWDRGWSPLGDGAYSLHKGSYALWNRTDLSDYAIRAEITAPEGAVGLMLNYVDENNYYKLELDARHGLVTLVKVVDNYESNIARAAATFTPDEAFTLEARVEAGKISASIDGHQIFAYPVEVRDLPQGAAGVWSWGAAGARFDDIAIVDLTRDFGFEVLGTAGNDRLTGTGADEVIASGAGRLDWMAGGLGADVFVFGAETANGMREADRITDYQIGIDMIDLGGAEIRKTAQTGSGVQLWIGDDQDQVIVNGATFDDLLFV